MIFEKYANMKYKYGNRYFGCRCYYVDIVGKNKNSIVEYIRNRIHGDWVYEKMSIKEFIDPFTVDQLEGNKKQYRFSGVMNSLFFI